MDAEELRRRVESLAATSTGQLLLRSGSSDESARLQDWIRSSQRGRPQRHATARTPTGMVPRQTRARERFRHRESHPLHHGDLEEHSLRSPAVDANGRPEGHPMVVKMEPSVEKRRFYLGLADPIERAPSIGPRTAERLEALGIQTVADFLQADPEATAARLQRPHVATETIRAWQQQATLVCRIPWLRGHDAQILVACGIHDPESLAEADAGELWRVVEPVIAGKAGSQMLRGATAPDLTEVQHWIQWAREVQQLKAA
jgi:hypothetical protein